MNEDLKLFLASHPLASDFICSTEVKQISDIKQYIADFYAFCKEKKIDEIKKPEMPKPKEEHEMKKQKEPTFQAEPTAQQEEFQVETFKISM